ncbi:hypothetical protein RHGRI_016287 [Rhododendron griersonianum]|uniref:C2H2-type domain-containing protein n=1 Tax=Rhododendron griersonianum TaxID=479676 RepID=A0AAV6JTM2_9ERIC|nr:hypothetical protein RHGRI_016287 [Rhododendron griersonianum]
MNSLLNPPKLLPLKPPSPPFTPHHKIKPQFPPHALSFKTLLTISRPRRRIKAAADHFAQKDVDMVKDREGVYAAKSDKVVVLWDLDNKPPRGPPYEAAMSLRHVAQRFGEVVDISAYANRHAFTHLPGWVAQQRRDRRSLDALERKGVVQPPSETYSCAVCGRKCKTNLDLKKHFKQLHVRERQKKLNRMKSLKGKKRQRFKERFISGNEKYNEAARVLITPKVGYGLATELRRAGVYVKTVEDKPQAADWALKRQMESSLSGGIGWLVLVSDDSDFGEMLRRARGCDLGTVVVGDADRALGRHADLWIPWGGVESGEVSEEDLGRRRRRFVEREDGFVEVTRFGGGGGGVGVGDLDSVLEELVSARTDFHSVGRNNRFFDGEEDGGEWVVEEGYEDYDEDDEFVLDSDDEGGGEEDDGFF